MSTRFAEPDLLVPSLPKVYHNNPILSEMRLFCFGARYVRQGDDELLMYFPHKQASMWPNTQRETLR